MLTILLLTVFLFITWDSWKKSSEEVMFIGYKTSYFHLSHGESKRIFEKMREDGMGSDSIKRFIMLEDRLLQIEQKSVCSGNPRVHEAFAISKNIRESFLGYDFSYHTKHLKQVAEPHKLINQSVRC